MPCRSVKFAAVAVEGCFYAGSAGSGSMINCCSVLENSCSTTRYYAYAAGVCGLVLLSAQLQNMFLQGQKKIDTFKESKALCLHHTSRSFGLPQPCFFTNSRNIVEAGPLHGLANQETLCWWNQIGHIILVNPCNRTPRLSGFPGLLLAPHN